MEITGKIIAVLPAKEGVSQSTGNPWKCQDYVLETQEMYPKKVCFNVFGAEKIQEMNIQLGETLTVSLEINANAYQGKWFIPTDNQHRHLSKHKPHFHLRADRRTMGSCPSEEQ